MMVILDAVGIATGMAGYALASKAEKYEWGAGETWIVCCLVGQIYYFPWNKLEGKARVATFKWSILNVAIHTIFAMGYACAVGYYKYARFDVNNNVYDQLLVTAITAMGLNVILGVTAIGIVLDNMDSRFPGETEFANAAECDWWDNTKGKKAIEKAIAKKSVSQTDGALEQVQPDQAPEVEQPATA